eukprot:CAMPEP_0203894878 /NCGR_PEP_ID=MMETSP0359-20131031/37780_1 /ASSEMBLY_ACC=CAM_ASM_000338 /TAXON_ID=268821 /ORGANISM="Scrippsiella Hangoei, Strain SHTV-5" /LENGTH=222 /DNA_ID=CAMNT_0050817267 /DNA_START=68 /DNA_END=733 /DNA_ORIENTATION=+
MEFESVGGDAGSADSSPEKLANLDGSDHANEPETNERSVSSHVLGMASLVLKAMLAAGMEESRSRRIKVSRDIGTARQFDDFYSCLLPATAWTVSIHQENVDGILAFSDYYQVIPLKLECERVLCDFPPSVDRLMQAHKYGLNDQYKRCVAALASDAGTPDLLVLKDHPSVHFDILKCMHQLFSDARAKLDNIKAFGPTLLEVRGPMIRCTESEYRAITSVW